MLTIDGHVVLNDWLAWNHFVCIQGVVCTLCGQLPRELNNYWLYLKSHKLAKKLFTLHKKSNAEYQIQSFMLMSDLMLNEMVIQLK